ncbi:MAG TPA: hypothetical protein VHM24_02545 [Gemmatimonadaceae bacterium]|nr:hypothetical protein [Gemmatimonadaceae bacterium]
MVLGPLNILRKRHNPVHSAVRRDVGIAAGIAGIVHTILGLQVHFGGKLARYFGVPHPAGGSAIAFVTTNYLGFVSAGILAVLVIISNNVAVRSLGLSKWKRIQRLAYVAAAAALVHGVVYQILEKRASFLIAFIAALSGMVVLVQLKGVRARADASRLKRDSGVASRK